MEAGRELDALVAEKVMGWTYRTFPNGACPHIKHWHGPNAECFLPHYSTSIADAWQMVEKLRLTVQPDEVSWMAGKKEARHRLYWDDVAEADTAPLAICLVALQIVGYQFNHLQ